MPMRTLERAAWRRAAPAAAALALASVPAGAHLASSDPSPARESAELTPPAQDYPSTHSALGRAAAEVLTAVLGDRIAFTVGSTTAVPEGTTRSFTSFRQAAAENADSRVRAGLHFRFSCDAGEELGRRIAELALATQLQPRAGPSVHASTVP